MPQEWLSKQTLFAKVNGKRAVGLDDQDGLIMLKVFAAAAQLEFGRPSSNVGDDVVEPALSLLNQDQQSMVSSGGTM